MTADLSETRARVGKALDAALVRARKQEAEEGAFTIDIAKDKFIIFSDLHKGARNGADDFRVCERAYNAALAYYFRAGHTLVTLGDVEELWEERPQAVIKNYGHTLRLEGMFHAGGRYLRFWGNHDDDWSFPNRVKKLLAPALGGGPLKVRETLIVHVLDGAEELGTIFLAHGHQGTLTSDKIAPISKLFVRYVWRPIQRLLKISFNTPAKDAQLRHAHDRAMYYWSEAQEKTVLIAGHTHRPVFKSQTHAEQVRAALGALDNDRAREPKNPELRRKGADLAAELEWVMASNQQEPGEPPVLDLKKPSYFNTGCCAFFDGDITGLEIADGEIRLVRLPDDEAHPQPKVLAHAALRDVFADC